MHEVKLAENIVAILEKEVESPEVGDVKTVHLEVGKLKYVVPDIMSSSFEHIPKSEKLRNAKLAIPELPVRIRCNSCGIEKPVENGEYFCSGCDSGDTEVIGGKEFLIKGIEW